MPIASHGPRKRPLAAVIALAALSAVTMVGLSQCINVKDNITGVERGAVDFRGGGASDCFRECRDRYADSLEAENELHEENMDDCRDAAAPADGWADRGNDSGNGNGGGNDHGRGKGRGKDKHKDRDCLARERERHQDALDRIRDGRRACQAACHHQGGGSGR